MKKQTKFGIGIAVIVVLGFLAWLGYGEQDVLPHDPELSTLQGDARAHRIRVGGLVEPGSIRRGQARVDFVLGEGKALPVSYVGSDPLPDTFI